MEATNRPPTYDRADPAARARAEVERRRRGSRLLRGTGSLALVALATALPFTADALLGSGAAVGAGVGAVLLAGIAVALWPYQWTDEEATHRALDEIWRQSRIDADVEVPWERFLAWAESDSGVVELCLIRREPSPGRVAGAPSPYTRQAVRRLDPDDIAAGAEAMEELRAEATRRESAARQRHEAALEQADRLAHEGVLTAIDAAAAADMKAREEALMREMAERDAVERAAQADALARALRRP